LGVVKQGATAEEILEGYSTLNKKKIAIAPLYRRAFPRRGRPQPPPLAGKEGAGYERRNTSFRSVTINPIEILNWCRFPARDMLLTEI
jgi:hypothetical protein